MCVLEGTQLVGHTWRCDFTLVLQGRNKGEALTLSVRDVPIMTTLKWTKSQWRNSAIQASEKSFFQGGFSESHIVRSYL